MRRTARSTLAFLLAASLPASGCSFVFVKGPTAGSETVAARQPVAPAPPACTHSMVWPAVDGAVGAILALNTIAALTENDLDREVPDSDKNERIGAGIVLGAVAITSAIVGYRRVSRCKHAKETFAAQYAQTYGVPYGTYPAYQPYAPQPYNPQPQVPPQHYPAQQPAPATPATNPTPPTAPTSATPPTPSATDLGTEGDVCSSTAECATGLTCSQNVCMRR